MSQTKKEKGGDEVGIKVEEGKEVEEGLRARVVSIGYDAAPFKFYSTGVSSSKLEDRAQHFIDRLARVYQMIDEVSASSLSASSAISNSSSSRCRIKTSDHIPLFILAHEEGGLIAKKGLSLLYANQKKRRFKQLLDRTKGIVFLSVPHRGASLVSQLIHPTDKTITSGELGQMINSFLHYLHGDLVPIEELSQAKQALLSLAESSWDYFGPTEALQDLSDSQQNKERLEKINNEFLSLNFPTIGFFEETPDVMGFWWCKRDSANHNADSSNVTGFYLAHENHASLSRLKSPSYSLEQMAEFIADNWIEFKQQQKEPKRLLQFETSRLKKESQHVKAGRAACDPMLMNQTHFVDMGLHLAHFLHNRLQSWALSQYPSQSNLTAVAASSSLSFSFSVSSLSSSSLASDGTAASVTLSRLFDGTQSMGRSLFAAILRVYREYVGTCATFYPSNGMQSGKIPVASLSLRQWQLALLEQLWGVASNSTTNALITRIKIASPPREFALTPANRKRFQQRLAEDFFKVSDLDADE
eukprot:TRINITY_DN2923_c0_g1_i1.p1 TRINITY_DN2923_c0_g1~~TRINITY_DN2923_c0_g1_i1.p1  ORF type:complete len:529 (-),score=136.92 TRINITY_DN2923_c0_g1_i1:78-1664(-)